MLVASDFGDNLIGGFGYQREGLSEFMIWFFLVGLFDVIWRIEICFTTSLLVFLRYQGRAVLEEFLNRVAFSVWPRL